jgi:hypothetical protein
VLVGSRSGRLIAPWTCTSTAHPLPPHNSCLTHSSCSSSFFPPQISSLQFVDVISIGSQVYNDLTNINSDCHIRVQTSRLISLINFFGLCSILLPTRSKRLRLQHVYFYLFALPRYHNNWTEISIRVCRCCLHLTGTVDGTWPA